MSSNVMPWSIKGVSAEARNLAKTAAGAGGEPIGPWLNQVIRAASAAERQAKSAQALARIEPAHPAALPAAPPAIDWRGEIEQLTERIAKLEQRAAALVGPLD